MFEWLFGTNRVKRVEEETRKGFESVKKDMDVVGKWVKHLDVQDKQLFDLINSLKDEISSIKADVEGFKEAFEMSQMAGESKQLFKKKAVLNKQTAVEAVQEAVQTPVQTADFYDILKGLTTNERVLIFTILNSEMKLSYEDLALLLGKERATIRGQVNAIKQKCEGLLEEFIEKNGKKRVFIPEEVRNKLRKYAKVRVTGKKKEEKT